MVNSLQEVIMVKIARIIGNGKGAIVDAATGRTISLKEASALLIEAEKKVRTSSDVSYTPTAPCTTTAHA